MTRFWIPVVLCCLLSACGTRTDGAGDSDHDSAPSGDSELTADLVSTKDADSSGGGDTGPGDQSWPFPLRPLYTSSDLRIIDDLGRDVLLRGVNITSLGEYWQGDPEQPPTLPTSDEDWQAMAASGVGVIRLVVHWSRIEPVRNQIDEAYLDQIETYVGKAAEQGIYTVIDMHQDAYTAFIHTPPEETCPEGTWPAKGWDGAPPWAVYTDGLSTCLSGDRNSSPAVQAAWNHFYDNTDGIRDRFVASWAAVAERFAGRPEVAGYDLLNEPEVSRPWAQLQPLYNQLIADTITAIRAEEAQAPFDHLLFVEPAIPAGHPSYGIVVPDADQMGIGLENVVSAPHNYAETISPPGLTITFEMMNDLYLGIAEEIGVPTWIGEYGFWSRSPETLEKLDRYAADEDKHRLGGAWWQWRQPCGDPHSVGPTGEYEVVHLNLLGCPGDIDKGPVEEFFRVFSRGYPRAVPGRIQSMTSDPTTGSLTVEAVCEDAGGTLVVWTPTSSETHQVVLTGLLNPVEHPIGNGRIVTATVMNPGSYSLKVEPKE